MKGTQIILGRTESSKGRRIGLLALMGLMAVLALAILIGGLATSRTAHADYDVEIDPWPAVEIVCIETLVEEGEDFRLEVRATHAPDWLYTRMRVLWYTDAATADESDYEHLHGKRQESTWPEADLGAMGRDFHTTEDHYSEIDESFTVRFENENEHGFDGECEITISDDDGVGIYDLEITSEPGEITTASGDEVEAYGAGDVIEITAHFTGTVTTLNPDTGERADHAGLHIQVGENRRVAELLSGDGGDELVFGYTVTADDADADGISVEGGGTGTGMTYDPEQRNGGLWAETAPGGRLNRLFHGLDDDRNHKVVAVSIDDESEKPDPPAPIGATPTPVPTPEPAEWAKSAKSIDSGLRGMLYGELVEKDGGRDWFSFEGDAGESYIIELRNRLELSGDDGEPYSIDYYPGHLIDPSILEIVDEEGEQVLGEHDAGGFIHNFARAFFTPDGDGTYYVAIGAGSQDRSLLGHYEITVREDDHADDHRVQSGLLLRPGDSVKANIDSDVDMDDRDVNPWDWFNAGEEEAVPIWGLESLDDRDVFRFEISEQGAYLLTVSDGPKGVGIWRIADSAGNVDTDGRTAPVESLQKDFSPGMYYVDVGTPYSSSGNTGTYTLMLTRE